MKTLLAILLVLTGVSGCYRKRWVPNTNYNNPDNWRDKKLPEADSIPIFPDDLDLGVSLPPGMTNLPAMVLPKNGEFFLQRNGARLTISGRSKEADNLMGDAADLVYWQRREAAAWLDPVNWKNSKSVSDQEIDEEGVCGTTDAVPHLERIPCPLDFVVFPVQSDFRVVLPEVPVSVGTLQLWKETPTNSEWQEFLISKIGSRDFIGREETRYSAVSIVRSTCSDKSGCTCGVPVGHSRQRLLDVVCGYAKKTCPSVAACYDPVRPVGHCCDICGAVLQLDIRKPLFDLHVLREHVWKHVSSGEHADVAGHAGKTGDTHVQIVLVDTSIIYNENSARLATILEQDFRDGKIPGVVSASIRLSGHPVLGSRWMSVTSTMFGSLLGVIVCMGLLYVLFIVHPPGSGFPNWARFQDIAHPFHFARFDNAPGEGDGVLQLGGEICEDEPYDPMRQAFDNPLYGQPMETTGGKEFVTTADEGQRNVTHENPVYSELRRKVVSVDEPDVEEEDDEDLTQKEDTFDEVVFVEN